MSRSKYKKFIEVKKDAPIYAKRIAKIMNKKGLSQKDLSERCKGEISVLRKDRSVLSRHKPADAQLFQKTVSPIKRSPLKIPG